MTASVFQENVYYTFHKPDGAEIRLSKTYIPSGILWEAQRWEMVDGQMKPVKAVTRLFGSEEAYAGVISKVFRER